MTAKIKNDYRTDAVLNELILRSIVDHAVVTVDINGIITSWNEGAERILGWTEEEIVGQSADVFFTTQDVEENRPEVEMRLAVENGRAEDIRWHVRKSGERFWGSGLMMPFLGSEAAADAPLDPSKIRGFVKIFRDRTVERNAELRLADMQDRAALAMRRSGTVGSYDLDIRVGVVIANETAARMHSVDVDLAGGGTLTETFLQAIVDEDREEVRALLQASIEDGRDFDATYRVITSEPWPTWVQLEGTVQRNDTGEPARLVGIVVNVTEQRYHLRLQNARLEFSEQVRDMKDTVEIAELASRVIGEALYVCHAGHGDIDLDGDTIDIKADWAASGHLSFVGQHRYSDFGTFASVLHAGEKVIMTDARTDPRAAGYAGLENLGVGALVNLPLMENGKLKAVLFVASAQPRDWTEAEIAFMDAMFDRTYAAIDRLRSEAQRDVLTEEIAHRMKNILAIAQVIVKQSLRHVPQIDAERRSIEARLLALSGAQDVLTRAEDQEADILSVVETTLAPHLPQQGRIEISGPSVPLTSNQVLGLSLALHELATNAAKYGALSDQTGRVLIDWNVDAVGRFVFTWTEREGPEVEANGTRGFGSTILERIVGSYFSGQSTLSINPEGISFEIDGSL